MDSLQHYCCCPITTRLYAHALNINSNTHHFYNLHTFLLCNHHINSTELLTCVALVVYAIYNTTNQLRYDPLARASHGYDMACQYLKEGVRRHPPLRQGPGL